MIIYGSVSFIEQSITYIPIDVTMTDGVNIKSIHNASAGVTI